LNNLINGEHIGDTWFKAMNYLKTVNYDTYNLIAEINNPVVNEEKLHQKLNSVLNEIGDQSIETVANTIFPVGLYDKNKSREFLYSRFMNLYPTLRQISDNSRGTYFGRLVAWNFESGSEHAFNQLEHTINKLTQVRHVKNRIRVRYEMAIYDPLLDHNSTMGFPCMSFISIKIRQDYIDMTAIYRNQHFIQKAYGNYVGLGQLLDFIARESGFNKGKLTCIATHAGLGKIDKGNLEKLLAQDEQITMDF
jgi:thymidylate synthase